MPQLKTYALRFPDTTIGELKAIVKAQQMPNSRTRIYCISTDAGESVVLLEIVGDADNPKTGRRWYDRAKESVEYIGRNWGPIVFILDRLCGK